MNTALVWIFLAHFGFSFGFQDELNFQVDNVQDRNGLVGRSEPGQETADNVGGDNTGNVMVDCHQREEGNEENNMKMVVRLKRMVECGRRTGMRSGIWR